MSIVDQQYAHYMGTKFIRIQIGTRDAYINVASIVSVVASNQPDRDGQTEIALANGETYFSPLPPDAIMNRAIRQVSTAQ